MARRPALPISLYVAGRRVAVVGDGPGASERADRLTAAGAEVVRLPDSAATELAEADHDTDPLSDCMAVVVHPSGPPEAIHDRLAQTARARGRLVYVHDRPAVSDFAMPALVQRGPLKLAVSTDGASPALSRRVREELMRLASAAARELDALIARLESLRESLPAHRRGELYEEARRLRFEGRIVIVDRDETSRDETSRDDN